MSADRVDKVMKKSLFSHSSTVIVGGDITGDIAVVECAEATT